MKEYLKVTEAIDYDNQYVSDTAKHLTRDEENVRRKAVELFYFVRDQIKYDFNASGSSIEDFKASITLQRKAAFCVPKAILLIALSRAIGIPARLRLAAIRSYILPEEVIRQHGNLFIHHGYVEFNFENTWVKATPTFDMPMCQKNGFIPVEFNGENDALLPTHDLNSRRHFEYVFDHGHYDDLPFKTIIELRKKEEDIFKNNLPYPD